jgi:hypothetical protein
VVRLPSAEAGALVAVNRLGRLYELVDPGIGRASPTAERRPRYAEMMAVVERRGRRANQRGWACGDRAGP